MHVPVEIIFRNMDRSMALVSEIQRRTDKLEGLFEQIHSCQVIIEAPNRPHRMGDLYRIRIQLTVPSRDFFVGKAADDVCENVDPFIAVHDGFDAIHRQLKDHFSEMNDNFSPETSTLHGRIARIHLPDGPDYPDRGFGYISTCDGREIYFNAKSLVGIEFQRLEIGNEVHFLEDSDHSGTRAKLVKLVE